VPGAGWRFDRVAHSDTVSDVETRTGGRGLDIATAVALGIVSLVTALGVLQSSAWTDAANRYASDAADARDQGVSNAVIAQLQQRADRAALLEAKAFGIQVDAALAAEDHDLALELYAEVTSAVTPAYLLPEGSFDAWWDAGFPDDGIPTDSPDYLVAVRGPADALALTSTELGRYATELKSHAAIFGQAALVHAIALFLFGVAGINRLRTTRYVTLGMGLLVFVSGLLLMATAY
jgi:hypothetical protein